MDQIKTPLLVILGPTASGKTSLATKVAARIGGEILSADSRQVYRDMDIGTGKDLDEYVVDGQRIPYHLINIREAGEQYNVNDFQKDFEEACQSVVSHGSVPIVCGGTGFYIYALLKGHAYASVPVNEDLRNELEGLPNDSLHERFHELNTSYHAVADTSTRKRLIRAIEIATHLLANPSEEVMFSERKSSYDAMIFGLDPAVEIRRERISRRLIHRLQNGLIGEVQSLLDRGLTREQLIYYGLEYKYITQNLTGETSYEFMKAQLETEIHRFAKRQMTFFRKMEKDGLAISWLPQDWTETEKIDFIIDRYGEFKNKLTGI